MRPEGRSTKIRAEPLGTEKSKRRARMSLIGSFAIRPLLARTVLSDTDGLDEKRSFSSHSFSICCIRVRTVSWHTLFALENSVIAHEVRFKRCDAAVVNYFSDLTAIKP